MRLSTLSAAPLLAASLFAQARAPEACFPDTSYAALTFAGLARCNEASAANKLFDLARRSLARAGYDEAALLQRPELGEALDHAREACAELGLGPDELRSLLQGAIALGIGRPSLQALGLPSLCLAIDVRGREATAQAVLAKLEGRAAAARVTFERNAYDFEGVEVVRRRESRSGFVVSHALADGWLLLATGTGYLEDCLRALRGRTPSLAASKLVARGRTSTGAPLVSLLLNARPLARALEPVAPYETAAVGRALGIEALEGIYWASGADATSATDVCLVGLPGDTKGLLKAPFHRPCTTRLAGFCPPDTLVYIGVACDRAAAAAACSEIAAHLPGELRKQLDGALRREVGRELNRELRQVGMKLQDLEPLADCLGDELAFAVSFERGTPQVTLLAELRDPQRTEALLLESCQKLLASDQGPKLHERDVHGAKLHFVTGRGMGFNPAFAIRDGVLIASPWRTNVENVLARAALGQPTLQADASFSRAMQTAAPASFVMHARMADVLAKVYGLGRAVLERQILEALPEVAPGDILPSVEELAAAIGDVTLAMGANDQGFHGVQRHPLGLGCWVALTGSALDWFLGRAALVKARRAT